MDKIALERQYWMYLCFLGYSVPVFSDSFLNHWKSAELITIPIQASQRSGSRTTQKKDDFLMEHREVIDKRG